ERNVSKKELPPEPNPLSVPVVDAHTHVDACGAETAAQRAAIIDRAQRAGVGRVVTVADDITAARWAVEASQADDRVFAAVAIHPTRAKDIDADTYSEVEQLVRSEGVVAVGETGLDYYWDYSPKEDQWQAFRWHIDLAKRVRLPLMIHDRDAHEDILDILDSEGAPETVVFHCFSGGVAMARRCVEAGYVLSFAGTVTFRNARDLHEVARLVPPEQYLVETDAPFLTPHPYRGRPNEP